MILIFIKNFMSFEMAPNNSEFNSEFNKFFLIHSNSKIKNFFSMIDPDLNFFDEIKLMRLTQKSFLYETQRFESISVLHVNIRGLKTNFENFGNLLNNKGSSFNTETWCSNSEIINSSRFDISKYNAILFKRRTNKREGSVLIYVKTDFMD